MERGARTDCDGRRFRRRRRRALVVGSALALFAGGCTVETETSTPSLEVFLPSQFTVDLPAGWTEPTGAESDAVMEEVESLVPADAEAKVELVALKRGRRDVPEALALITQEPADGATLEELVAGFQKNVSEASPTPLDFGEPTAVEFAGDEAVFFDYEGTVNEFRTLLTIHGDNEVTIELVAPPGELEATIPEFEEILSSWSWFG